MHLRSPQELKRILEQSPKWPIEGGARSDGPGRNREKLAERRLDIALIFARSSKLDMARRLLRRIIIEFEGTTAAHDASAILKKLASSARG